VALGKTSVEYSLNRSRQVVICVSIIHINHDLKSATHHSSTVETLNKMTDNTLAKARALGAIDGRSIVKRDVLNRRDRVDFYSFTLNRSSSVNLGLSGLRANADLAVMNSSGQTMLRSSRGGTKPEQLQADMDAGTYYVQVRGRSNKGTNYRLSATAINLPDQTPPPTLPPTSPPPTLPPTSPPPLPPEGTIDNPHNLGLLTSGNVTRARDSASATSPRYYKFQLQSISDVNITLSNVSASTRTSLYYDSNNNGRPDTGERFEAGSASTTSSNPISGALPATGTYFLEIDNTSSQSASIYDLVVGTTPNPGNIPTDPGGDAPTAYRLGSLNRGGRIEVREYVGELDGADYYSFTMAENATVNFNFSSSPGTIGARTLYRDINGNGLIDDNERVNGLSYTESVGLISGNYFLAINRGTTSSSNDAYQLIMTANA
jgi:trimeric autotransporter adhesin